MYSERWGMVSSITVFTGFFFTFMPQFLLGNAGMPRRYYSYPAQYQWLHVLSTGGATILAAGLLLTLLYLVAALARGARAPDNPWESRTFEWSAPTPPPKHNFEQPPTLDRDPYEQPPPEQT
jgi:cytochrome c oxidase subunit 1